MRNGELVKFGWFVAGLVVGGAVAVGIVELVTNIAENDSSNEDYVTNSTGTRVQESLQFVIVVSNLYCITYTIVKKKYSDGAKILF